MTCERIRVPSATPLRRVPRPDPVEGRTVRRHDAGHVPAPSIRPSIFSAVIPRGTRSGRCGRRDRSRVEKTLPVPPVAVQAPARLDAQSAVGALAAEVRGEEAFAGVGVAHRPWTKISTPTGERAAIRAISSLRRWRSRMTRDAPIRANSSAASAEAQPACVLMCTGIPGKKFVEDPHQPEIRRDDRVGRQRRHLVEQADRFGEVRPVRRVFIATYSRTPRARARGPYAAKIREAEILRPLARVELPEAQIDGVGARVDGGVVGLRGPGGCEEPGNAGRGARGERDRGPTKGRRALPRLRRGGTPLPLCPAARDGDEAVPPGDPLASPGRGGSFTSPGPRRTTRVSSPPPVGRFGSFPCGVPIVASFRTMARPFFV